ncbi:PadR family transcriptional regulator [Leucothrix pacifica]|uniref:PadR family transcriptional regulator n=2 Tax=Leucothrix pacifica TaxID=1247513 RepID=A0A317C5I2_9GAMM|nr:PadR family transcriptional regulator [Leucothrix pacifica]
MLCIVLGEYKIMENTTYQKWLAQLRKGYLELCVLTVLKQKESSYGFEILQTLEQAGLPINEGTLYPLLNRMFKNGWLTSHWVTPSEGGHPRRHYQLSDDGAELLPSMLDTFQNNQQALDKLRDLK